VSDTAVRRLTDTLEDKRDATYDDEETLRGLAHPAWVQPEVRGSQNAQLFTGQDGPTRIRTWNRPVMSRLL
jgi:hypothetical protein